MSEFEPIRPNPYIVGNPIKSEEMFYGRQDDFDFVRKKMATMINQIIVLYGQRRCGKTSILFQILNGRLGSDFLPILIDMQTMAGVNSNSDFYKRILTEIIGSLERISLTAPQLEISEDEHRWLDNFRALFDDIRKSTGGKLILLLLDEYEIIEQKIKAGEISHSVIMQLATLLESQYNIGFIFTGSTHLEDRRQPYWNHLLSKSIARRISFLTEQDTRRLCTEPIFGKVEYQEESLALIYRLTAGHPFYTQVVCQNLVDLLNERRQRKVTLRHLEEIVDEIVENPLPQMIYYWDSLNDATKVVLSLLAGALPDSSHSFQAEDIYNTIAAKKYDISISLARINETCEQMYHDDLFAKTDHTKYNFRVDLFRHWIKREHSIWQVIREIGPEFRKRYKKFRGIYLTAALILLAAMVALFLQVMPKSEEPGAVKDTLDLYEAIIISNVEGLRLSLDQGPLKTFPQKTIQLDSLEKGEHIAILYPPDTLWTPDSVVCKMNIAKDRQLFQVDFSPRQVIEITHMIIEKQMADIPKTSPSDTIAEPNGMLSIITQPEGAIVYLDNDSVGISPITEIPNLQPGRHHLRLEKRGYETFEKTIEINRDESNAIVEALEPLTGQLTIYVMGMWASIKINGESYERTPLKDIVLPIGTYEITLENPAYQPYVCNVEIIEGDTYVLSVLKNDFKKNSE